MLDKDALKKVMMDSTYLSTDYLNALHILGLDIAQYIINNTVLIFSWVAVNTIPPFNTENTTPNGEILTCPINLTLSYAKVPVNGLVHMAEEIVAGIKLSSFNITDVGYSTSQNLLSDCPDFSLTINGTDSRDSAFDQLATQIVNQLKSYHPTPVISGSHSTYKGATTFCTIT